MYGSDLAAFHAKHGIELAREAATTLVDELAEASLHHGLVADVGCGDGTLSKLLWDAGYDVLAIDPSESFLEMVAERLPEAQLILSTAARMRLPAGLVAIAAVGEVLSYDLRIDLDETLERFHTALRPGGIVLLDLPGRGRHATAPLVVEEHDEALLVMRTAETSYRLQRDITLFTEEPDGRHRRTTEIHELRLYDAGDVRTSLSRAGFVAIRQLERYGAVGPELHDGWAGFIAERR
ncbi:hypothetical protein BH23ACT9_BH23ACT9_34030 [soil metagenome]